MNTQTAAPTLPSGRVRRVTEYIEQNLDKELRLTELAALVYMSPFHFARLFKCSTGAPPHQFVIRQRIARASAFLAQPELSVAEISRRGGVRTPTHFPSLVRPVTGVTPRGYPTEHVLPEQP